MEPLLEAIADSDEELMPWELEATDAVELGDVSLDADVGMPWETPAVPAVGEDLASVPAADETAAAALPVAGEEVEEEEMPAWLSWLDAGGSSDEADVEMEAAAPPAALESDVEAAYDVDAPAHTHFGAAESEAEAGDAVADEPFGASAAADAQEGVAELDAFGEPASTDAAEPFVSEAGEDAAEPWTVAEPGGFEAVASEGPAHIGEPEPAMPAEDWIGEDVGETASLLVDEPWAHAPVADDTHTHGGIDEAAAFLVEEPWTQDAPAEEGAPFHAESDEPPAATESTAAEAHAEPVDADAEAFGDAYVELEHELLDAGATDAAELEARDPQAEVSEPFAAILDESESAEAAPVAGAESSESATPAAGADAFVQVAERLERIAASLRTGAPGELLTRETTDPLELLLVGFALGYSQAEARRAAPAPD